MRRKCPTCNLRHEGATIECEACKVEKKRIDAIHHPPNECLTPHPEIEKRIELYRSRADQAVPLFAPLDAAASSE